MTLPVVPARKPYIAWDGRGEDAEIEERLKVRSPPWGEDVAWLWSQVAQAGLCEVMARCADGGKVDWRVDLGALVA